MCAVRYRVFTIQFIRDNVLKFYTMCLLTPNTLLRTALRILQSLKVSAVDYTGVQHERQVNYSACVF